MNPEDFARLRQLFHAALDLEPGARRDYVARQAEELPELASRLAELLRAHESEGHWLEGDVLTHAASLLAPFDTAPPGTRIGSYRVLRELGRGGMGAVYLARHEDDSIAQQVAIKLIKRGMDSEEILRRFVVERRILSGLNHPHIARLYDGGTTEDGRPFFVMEAIEGQTLTQFANSRQLDLEARLRLLLPVIAAVSYAHQNLVVHRDLKPANVLVGADGVPKLLDFGIAKLLAPELGSAATALEMRPRTPDYASPEQLAGQVITTATDVFGLGLLLYELISGVNPLLHPAGRTADGEPRPPSQMMRLLGPTENGVGRRTRRLSGDLDGIVGKAMATDPARRYGSARELAEDLERTLEHRPVKARRPTLLYRLGSAVRRHRLATAAAAAVVAFALAAFHQAWEASRQRDLAQGQQRRTLALAVFLVNLFDVADPNRSLGKTVTARELLDEGARRLVGEAGRPLANDPEIRGHLLNTVGRVYRNLGLETEARSALLAAQALRHGGENEQARLDEATTEIELGHLDRLAARHPDSEQRFRRALALYESVSPLSPGAAEAMNGLGLTLRAAGRDTEGESLLAEALERRRQALDLEDTEPARLAVAESLGNLAAVALDRQQAELADRLLTEARQLEEPIVGGDHPRRAVELANLAALLHRRGDFAGAARQLGKAVEIRRRVLPADHPDLAVSLSSQASLQLELAHFDQAVALAKEAIGILEPRGPSTDLAHALLAMGNGLREQGDLEAAGLTLERALELYRRLLGEEHFLVANAIHSLAWLAHDQGEPALARQRAERALELRLAALGPRHAALAASKALLASLFAAEQDWQSAEKLEREALALREELLPEDHPARASSLSSLGALLLATSRAGEAETPLRKALGQRRLRLPADHPSLAVTESTLGATLCGLGRKLEGRALLEQGWRKLMAARGASHRDTGEAVRRLARCS